MQIKEILQVEYNQEIAFIRRLCIRVDANEDFLESNIVELVGNLTFVKANYNDIFANYKNISISNFSGVVIIYEIAYDLIIAKEYNQGIFSRNTQVSVVSKVTDEGKCFRWGTVWIEISYPNHPDGVGCNNAPNGYWQDTFIEIICPSSGGSSGSGSGGTSTGEIITSGTNTGTSGSPSGATATTIDNGCSFCELDENATPPSVTGDIYTNAKADIDNSIVTLTVNVAGEDTTKQYIKVKNRMLNGLKQMHAIMRKIEGNTKGVNLHVVASATDTTGGTKYGVANNRLLITMPTTPVLPPNPTPEQELEFDDKMTKHIALLAHELKHMKQYLDGKVSFNKLTGEQGVLVDAIDENVIFCVVGYFPLTTKYALSQTQKAFPKFGKANSKIL